MTNSFYDPTNPNTRVLRGLAQRRVDRARLQRQQEEEQRSKLEEALASSKLPDWAKEDFRRSMRGEDTHSTAEKLLGKGVGLVSKALGPVGDMPTPLVADTQYWLRRLKGENPEVPRWGKTDEDYVTLGNQSRRAGEQVRALVPGAAGRIASKPVEFAADPVTIAGAFLTGPGVFANLAGRGSMSVGRYAAVTGAAGLGAGVGRELAGGPGELVGGFGGGFTALRNMQGVRERSRRWAGEATARLGEKMEAFSPEIGEALQRPVWELAAQGRYNRGVLEDGTPVQLVTRTGLGEQIQARRARAYRMERQAGQSANRGDLEEWKANTEALENLHHYMSETGREELALADYWDAGRKLGHIMQGQGDMAEWTLRSAEAAKRRRDIEEVIGAVPDVRFTQRGKAQGMRQLLREDITPEIQAQMTGVMGLRQQLDEGAKSITKAAETTMLAKRAGKERMTQVLSQMPSGSRTAARNYISALIQGDEKGIADAAQNLAVKVKFSPDFEVMEPEFQDVVALHRAAGEAEAGEKALRESHRALTGTYETERKKGDDLINQVFGKSAANIKKRLLRPVGVGQNAGGGNLYRMTGLTSEDGALKAVLQRVDPAADAKQAVESGARIEADEAGAIREAQAKLEELLAERTRLRETKAGKDQLQGIRQQIDAQKAEVARLREPARPIPREQLGDRSNKLIVPLDDAMKFDVFEPATSTPAALRRESFRDARTVALLNDQTRVGLEKQQIENAIAQGEQRLQQLEAGVSPEALHFMERVQGLSAQGVDVRSVLAEVDPAVVENLRRIEQQRGTLEQLAAQLEGKSLDLDAIEGRVLNSQMALEATLQDAAYQDDFAREQLAQAAQRYQQATSDFESTLNLGPENLAQQQLEMFKATNDYFLNTIRQKAEGKPQRLTQAAFDSLLSQTRAFATRSWDNLPKGFHTEYGASIDNLERLLPDMGWRAAIRQMAAPKEFAESNIDPDAMRSGPGGWVRRVLMGTGFSAPEFEGLGATFLNDRANASFIAKANYQGAKIETARVADSILNKMAAGTDEEAAWARNLLNEKDIDNRLRGFVGRMAKPATDKAWQKELGWLKAEGGLTPDEEATLYRVLSDSFLVAGLKPELFDMRKVPAAFGMLTREWGKRMGELQDLADNKGIVRNLVKREFREFAPTGRLLPVPGTAGEAIDIPKAERNIFTDLVEVIRNSQSGNKNIPLWLAANDSLPAALRYQGGALPLERMMVNPKEWEEALAANLLNKVNTDATYDKLGRYLNDPSQVAKLKRGQPISRSEWKSEDYADSWEKLDGILHGDNPTGFWGNVEQVRRGAQRLAGSTIMGDLGWGTIQEGLLASLSPAAAGRVLAKTKSAALTDLGFHTWMTDPENYNFLRWMASKGVVPTSEAMFGGERVGNVWEMLPGVRKLGKLGAGLDKITFDRMNFIARKEAVQTLLKDVQLLKAMGPETAQTYVDGIPVLKDLHSKADLWQSTNDEIADQVLRAAENTMGGVRPSTTLLGANRQRLESMILFVPGFFRARAGLINQASRALTNPQSPEGWLAMSILAREAQFRLGMGALVAAASGTLPEFQDEVESWAAFDPRKSGGMLSGPLGDGGYLGLSWGNAAPRLYAQMLAGNQAGQFNLDPTQRLAAMKNFFEGRENPVIRGIVEQIEGKDFFGRRVATPKERMLSAAQNVLPIWLGEGLDLGAQQIGRDGKLDPATLAAASGAEFLGLNYKANTPYDVMNTRFKAWQTERFPGEQPLDWRDAPGDLKRMAKGERSEIADAEGDWQYDMNRRAGAQDVSANRAFNLFKTQQAEFDQQQSILGARLKAGQMTPEQFREAYGALQEDRADASDYLSRSLRDIGIDLEKGAQEKAGRLVAGESPALALALNEYRSVRPSDFPIDQTRITEDGRVLDSDIDWTAYRQAREAVLGRYPKAVQEQVRQYLEPEDENVRAMQGARNALDAYFDRVPKYRGLDVTQGRYVDFVVSSLRALEQQWVAANPRRPVNRAALYEQGMRALAQAGKIPPEMTRVALLARQFALNPQMAVKARSPESILWLQQHPEIVEWFPWMQSETPRRFRTARETDVDLDAIERRELRGQ